VGQRATIDTTARLQASAARFGELILDLLQHLSQVKGQSVSV